MGDQGRLYVNDDVVPAYKKVIHHADLILPNQFEAEYATFFPFYLLFLCLFLALKGGPNPVMCLVN